MRRVAVYERCACAVCDAVAVEHHRHILTVFELFQKRGKFPGILLPEAAPFPAVGICDRNLPLCHHPALAPVGFDGLSFAVFRDKYRVLSGAVENLLSYAGYRRAFGQYKPAVFIEVIVLPPHILGFQVIRAHREYFVRVEKKLFSVLPVDKHDCFAVNGISLIKRDHCGILIKPVKYRRFHGFFIFH